MYAWNFLRFVGDSVGVLRSIEGVHEGAMLKTTQSNWTASSFVADTSWHNPEKIIMEPGGGILVLFRRAFLPSKIHLQRVNESMKCKRNIWAHARLTSNADGLSRTYSDDAMQKERALLSLDLVSPLTWSNPKTMVFERSGTRFS